MIDTGWCYMPKDFAKVCKPLRLKQIRTKPCMPQIHTALLEWA